MRTMIFDLIKNWGICQLVLMDADTSHLNVGGVFLRKQTINS